MDVFQRIVGVLSAKALERGLAPMLVPDLTGRSIPIISFMLDGYIVLNPHRNDPVVELLRNRGIPYVTQGADPQRPDFQAWASEDDAASCRTVLDHFAAGVQSGLQAGGLHVPDDVLVATGSDSEHAATCARRSAPSISIRRPRETICWTCWSSA
ncbi:hypothetical protein [Zhihengliuella sp.]|uniref:hypothetical protein n=1 Tax=Zhihengliuella sp. TaxID=1954483 RepID=UPI00281102C3|nr:hypothetical protein [Zhihengliuella sp.]